MSAADRFWAKVRRGGPDECWPWIGTVHRNGRGFHWNPVLKRNMLASRMALWLSGGLTDLSLFACHTCNNAICANPAHLYAGTNQQNCMDASIDKRLNGQGKTHCKSGHPLSGDNLYHRPRGGRGCLECARASRAKWMAENRARRNEMARKRRLVRRLALATPTAGKEGA